MVLNKVNKYHNSVVVCLCCILYIYLNVYVQWTKLNFAISCSLSWVYGKRERATINWMFDYLIRKDWMIFLWKSSVFVNSVGFIIGLKMLGRRIQYLIFECMHVYTVNIYISIEMVWKLIARKCSWVRVCVCVCIWPITLDAKHLIHLYLFTINFSKNLISEYSLKSGFSSSVPNIDSVCCTRNFTWKTHHVYKTRLNSLVFIYRIRHVHSHRNLYDIIRSRIYICCFTIVC